MVYKILDLTYPKIDTDGFPDKLFKLNSSKEITYLGTFKPCQIDDVLFTINVYRLEVLQEISRNMNKMGFSLDEKEILSDRINSILTYSQYSRLIDDKKKLLSNLSKNRFEVTTTLQKEALDYAHSKIAIKEKKFEVTLKEVDRYEEKYSKEYLSNLKTQFLEKESDSIIQSKEEITAFLNKYTLDVDGYTSYIADYKDDYIYSQMNKDFDFFIPTDETQRHTFISGQTGSGKSELIKLLIYSDILKRLKSHKISTVLIEPHGDLSLEIVNFTENYKNNDLIYISPDLDSRYTLTINPFEIPFNDKTEQNIDILASELVGVFKTILGSSFTIPMESVLLPVITAVLYRNEPQSNIHAGIEEVQRFMDDNNNGDLVKFASENLPNINHQSFFKNGYKNKSLSVTKQALYTKIQTLLNSTIFSKLIQGRSTLDFEKELNSGKLIVINLSKGLMGELASKFFGALVIALINYIVLKRTHQVKEQRVPIKLIIDESQNYVSNSIEVALTELRKYGLYLTLVTQIVGQNANSQLEKIIMSNTNIKIIGQNATDSLDKLSKEIQVPTKELQTLQVGEFYIKIGSKDAIKFSGATMLLNSTNQISTSQFNQTKHEQLQKYYKLINDKNSQKPQVKELPKKFILPIDVSYETIHSHANKNGTVDELSDTNSDSNAKNDVNSQPRKLKLPPR